ncbi:MAG: cytochrome c [Caldimonas sp.]
MTRTFMPVRMVAAALLGLGLALPTAAQFAKPEQAIRYRQSVMTVMNRHFGIVAAMAAGKIPFDAKAAAENADIAAAMSKLPFVAFVEGSDKGNTKAEPKIWTETDKFHAAATKMQDAMARFDVAAKGGNLDAIKVAVDETGRACKACHDSYRKE